MKETKSNKVCNFCGNKNSKEMFTHYIYRYNEKYLFVNNVPCETCEFCGEQYFKARVLKKIEKDFKDIYFNGKKVKQQIKVPVVEFQNS